MAAAREAQRAYRDARLQAFRRPRGRRADGVNFAYHQLGLGLAVIWFTVTGRRPTCRWDGIGHSGEGGRFHAFVSDVLAILPTRLRVMRKDHLPRIDRFVRVSVEACKEALAAPEAYRQLGLLDERRWLQDLPPASRGGTRTTA